MNERSLETAKLLSAVALAGALLLAFVYYVDRHTANTWHAQAQETAGDWSLVMVTGSFSSTTTVIGGFTSKRACLDAGRQMLSVYTSCIRIR